MKKTLAVALSSALLGGMLSVGNLAIAEDKVPPQVTAPKVTDQSFYEKGNNIRFMKQGKGFMMRNQGGGFVENLDQLVKEGVLTQKKVDAIKDFLNKAQEERPAKGKRVNLFSQLVENKILTQAEADKVQTKIMELRHKERQEEITKSLNALVEKGTLKKEQVNKLLSEMEQHHKTRQELMDKVKNMTPEVRREYFTNNQVKFQNPIEKLIADGVITEAEAQAIKEEIGFGFGKGCKGFKGGKKGFGGREFKQYKVQENSL